MKEQRKPYKGISSRAIEFLSHKSLGVAVMAIFERAPSYPRHRLPTPQELADLAFTARLIEELRKSRPEAIDGLLMIHEWRFTPPRHPPGRNPFEDELPL
jgi:hypothetical protein